MSVLTVDHNFTSDDVTKAWNVPVSGAYMFYGVGVYDGACLELECSPDNGVTWLVVAKLSVNGRSIHHLVTGERVRIRAHSSGLTTDLNTGIRQ